MNDERTPEQKYQAWIDAVNKAWGKGWICECKWIFVSPRGSYHDLSAADFNKLDEIVERGLFAV
jgi:hypothetical protein